MSDYVTSLAIERDGRWGHPYFLLITGKTAALLRWMNRGEVELSEMHPQLSGRGVVVSIKGLHSETADAKVIPVTAFRFDGKEFS